MVSGLDICKQCRQFKDCINPSKAQQSSSNIYCPYETKGEIDEYISKK